MPLDFPLNPTVNQTYTLDSRVWVWDGVTWNLSSAPLSSLNSISVVDNGGDGSLTYNSGTGVLTYTGPTATDIRAHFSAGSGITITTGNVSVDATVIRTTGAQTAQNKTLQNTTMTGRIGVQVYTLTGTVLDPTNGNLQIKVLAAPTVFTETLSNGDSIMLMLSNGNTYSVTWPPINWVTSLGNVEPARNAADAYVLWKANNQLYGAWVGRSA